ncbi:MAG TPA: 6-carboxytetrahydropterin synthase [Dehalococcoidia bacterium]|nr:6-carboxytetrahydropterin synthase [Dehalococcoidia bacterium]
MTPDQRPYRAARVQAQRLKFAAAHMATFGGSIEPLHGHNYAVTIEAEGELSAIGWVADFGLLKHSGRKICERLDHHFLLQGASREIEIARQERTIALRFGEKGYVFPAEDVLELPIANTTAELIAEWFWWQVVEALHAAAGDNIRRITVGVEEAPGQAGWFADDLPPALPA